jgi:hypothetical protein
VAVIPSLVEAAVAVAALAIMVSLVIPILLVISWAGEEASPF